MLSEELVLTLEVCSQDKPPLWDIHFSAASAHIYLKWLSQTFGGPIIPVSGYLCLDMYLEMRFQPSSYNRKTERKKI